MAKLTTRIENATFLRVKAQFEGIQAKLAPSLDLALVLKRELEQAHAPRAPGLRPALADFIEVARRESIAMAIALREIEEMALDQDFTPHELHDKPEPPAPPDARPRTGLTPPPRRR